MSDVSVIAEVNARVICRMAAAAAKGKQRGRAAQVRGKARKAGRKVR